MFRKAVWEDRETVYRLISDMEERQLPFQRFSQIFQRQLENENYCCLIDQRGGQCVGILNLRFEEQLHHGDRVAEIMEFVVDPRHRGNGIGGRLFAHACQVARDHGCSQIEVACNQLRTDTHRFYTRQGMHNFHFKFSRVLMGEDPPENRIGR